MRKISPATLTLLFLLAGGPAAAQQNPYNTPPPSRGLPQGWGEQDVTVNPSANDQIARGARQAATERAARAGRRGHSTRARPANPEEIVAGTALADSAGAPIGIVESVTADGAIVASGAVRVMVPLDAFGIDGDQLLLGITRAEFEAAAAGAHP